MELSIYMCYQSSLEEPTHSWPLSFAESSFPWAVQTLEVACLARIVCKFLEIVVENVCFYIGCGVFHNDYHTRSRYCTISVTVCQVWIHRYRMRFVSLGPIRLLYTTNMRSSCNMLWIWSVCSFTFVECKSYTHACIVYLHKWSLFPVKVCMRLCVVASDFSVDYSFSLFSLYHSPDT